MFGCGLEGCVDVFWCVGDHFGASWGGLRPILVPLERSLAGLGVVLGPLEWRQEQEREQDFRSSQGAEGEEPTGSGRPEVSRSRIVLGGPPDKLLAKATSDTIIRLLANEYISSSV